MQKFVRHLISSVIVINTQIIWLLYKLYCVDAFVLKDILNGWKVIRILT